MIRDTPAGVEFDVRVVPRARRTAFAGEREGAIVVRLAAPPVDGAANDTLIEFIAARLRVPRRAIRILSGERSRRKRLSATGVTADRVRRSLDE